MCRCYYVPWYSQRWVYLIIESPVPIRPPCEGVQGLATASWLSRVHLHNDLPRLPLLSHFLWLLSLLLSFPIAFNISCLPVPYQELCSQREFTCKTAVQSSVPFSEKSAVKRAERWAGSAWWSAFKLLDALQWLKIVIFQSNKHTIHELKLRIFLTVLFHNLYLIWINKPFVPPQTYLNLTDLIHQLLFSSNNGLPYQNNAFVL